MRNRHRPTSSPLPTHTGTRDRLRALYQAARHPEDVVISYLSPPGPDCPGPGDLLGLLEELNRIKPVRGGAGLADDPPGKRPESPPGATDLPVFGPGCEGPESHRVDGGDRPTDLWGFRRKTPEMSDPGDRPLYRSKRAERHSSSTHLLHVLRTLGSGPAEWQAGRVQTLELGGIYFHSGAVPAESSAGGQSSTASPGTREAGPAAPLWSGDKKGYRTPIHQAFLRDQSDSGKAPI